MDLIKEGREKLEGVSDAPWKSEPFEGSKKEFIVTNNNSQSTLCDPYNGKHDSDFMAWSRNNMEALLDKLEWLENSSEFYKLNTELLTKYQEQQNQIDSMNKVVEAAKELKKTNVGTGWYSEAMDKSLDSLMEALAELKE